MDELNENGSINIIEAPSISTQLLTEESSLQTNTNAFYVLNPDGKLTLLDSNAQNFTPTTQTQEPQDDDDLARLLKSWELYDQLYTYLKSKKIVIEGLKYMKERHIDQLFYDFEDFNLKVIFEHKLSIWQSANGVNNLTSPPQHKLTKELSVESLINNISSPQSSNASETDITAFDILNRTEQSKAIIQTYSAKQHLAPEDRTNLVHKIVQYFTENGKKNYCEKM